MFLNDMVASFDAVTRQRPDDHALSDLVTDLTFGQVRARVGSMAAALTEHGGSDPVLVLAERSVESVCALIAGMWGARGTIPISATDPAERIAAAIELIGPCLVLDTTRAGIDAERAAAVRQRAPLIRSADIDGSASDTPPTPTTPDALGMIVLTSGSTGAPKGVFRRNTSLGYAFRRSSAQYAANNTTRIGSLSPLNFLGGLTPPLWGVSSGLSSTLYDPANLDGDAFVDAIIRYGTDALVVTPSLARIFVPLIGATGRQMPLRRIITVGEPLDWADVADIRAHLPDITVENVYGASETAGLALRFEIAPDMPLGEGRVPLGRADDPERLRLDPVDGSDRLFEVVVRKYVSDGYWRDPELTASRWGIDTDGVRTYRTGDLVTIDEHGMVLPRGRADDMLKVNGRVVEPAEAEHALAAVPGIVRAIVLPRTLPSGKQQFVGHLETDGSITAAEIRSALQRQLPDYLIPAVLMRHDSLPITDRGKVDRLRLRTTEVVAWRDISAHRPTHFVEDGVAAIVARILGIPDLHPDDNLWQMGCDSLLAIEIVSAVLDAYGGTLAPNDLITAATAREISMRLRSASQTHADSVAVNEHLDATPLHLVAGAGSPALTYRAFALAMPRPVVIYQQHGLEARFRWSELADRSVAANATRHLAEVRRRQPHGPYLLAGHSLGGRIAHEMALELVAAGEQVAIVMLDSGSPAHDRLGVDGSPRVLSATQRSALELLNRAREKAIDKVANPTGVPRRYRRFYHRSLRQARRHRVRPLPADTPILYVAAAHDSTIAGWLEVETEALDIVRVEGDHNSMVVPPHAHVLAAAVEQWLDSTMPADRRGTALAAQ